MLHLLNEKSICIYYGFIYNFFLLESGRGKQHKSDKRLLYCKKNDLSTSSKWSAGDKVQVYTQFIIDNNNEIKILSVKGPDLFLEKRATQIINELPKVSPEFISSREKNHKYTMAIKFEIVN